MGEGWHNFHHSFPFDYATAEKGSLLQFNPTKIFIDTAAFFGLVTNRRKATLGSKKLEDTSSEY